MKKFYSILMASAVALSASALSIETENFGSVQDFRAKKVLTTDLSAKTITQYKKGDLPKLEVVGKRMIQPGAKTPSSRVLGEFDGNVEDYTITTYLDYLTYVQSRTFVECANSDIAISITKEATADADAEVAIAGFFSAIGQQGNQYVELANPIKGTMSSTGEISLPYEQVLYANDTYTYVFTSVSDDETVESLVFNWNPNDNRFECDDLLCIGAVNNKTQEFAGFYTVAYQPVIVAPNGMFVIPAYDPEQGQDGQLPFPVFVEYKQDDEDEYCLIAGISVFGGETYIPTFEVDKTNNALVAYNAKLFASINFSNSSQRAIIFDDFMLASYDETLKANIFPVVASYDPELGKDDNGDKIYDVYVIPSVQFVDPYMNFSLWNDYYGYATGDGYIFIEKEGVSGVEDVTSAPAKTNARYYNVQGMEVKAPAKGQVVIEKAGDTARKIVF